MAQKIYLFGEKGSGTVSKGQVQDFYKLREECLRKNVLFEDPSFPADDTSLFYSKHKITNYKWLRPREVSSDPLLFVDGTSRFDVIQGNLGNCWFAASLAGLARYKQLVYQVVPNDQGFDENYAGIFHFRFWQYGKWIDIVIDDRLPFKAVSPISSLVESIGDLAFFKSSDQDEFWTALLEKAYAKLHGSYEALERGNSLEAMQDFTGGISEEFIADVIPENFFEILLTAKQRCSLMACCFHEDYKNRGLEPAHAYTITDIKLIDTDATNIELIRIRNPWGRKEWTGNFCDQDSVWNILPQSVKDELEFQDKVDGEFWMEFNDFKNVFTFVVVCNLTPESLIATSGSNKKWNLQMLEGQWVNGVTAGGSKPIENLAKNPQYLLTLEQPDSNGSGKCSIIVSLMQRNRRSQRHKGLQNLTIGYDVRRVHNVASISKPLNVSSLSTFRSRFRNPPLAPVRDLSCRLLLKPVTYCIIPFTADPEQEGEYLLRIFSENGVKLEYFDEEISYNDENIDNKIIIQAEQEIVSDESFHLFSKYVSDKEGELNWVSLQKLLTDIYSGFTKEVCRSLLAMLDMDRSGKLSLAEFRILWNNIQKWQITFKLHDIDKSGNLDTSELRNALKSIGFGTNFNILNLLVRRYSNGNSKLALDDFLLCVIKLKTATETFKHKDPENTGCTSFTLDEWTERCIYS